MHIGFVYDLRAEYRALGYSEEDTAEFDSPETIDALAAAFARLGHRVTRVGSGRALAGRLVAGERFDLVFSIAEGLAGRSREAQVPALCELFGQPYALSDPLTVAACHDKAVAKRLVRDAGVATAPFACIETVADATHVDLPFPVFLKPVAEGTGKGCGPASLVRSQAALARQAAHLLARHRQPVLAEPFLPGREFTVGILGARDPIVLGVLEIVLRDPSDAGVYSYRAKESSETLVDYRLADDGEARRAGEVARQAYRALGCRDAARIDVRSDAEGAPQFLEANPLPGLHPTHSDLPMVATHAGRTYDWLVEAILAEASARAGIGASPVRLAASA